MEKQDHTERLSKAKQWIQDLFKKEDDYTDEDIIRYHEEIYNACGLEKPKVIILDSPFLCKQACLVFSKIDKFIKHETKKYCKKNKNDKKYLLDHLFENWHNLFDDEHFDDYTPNKNYVVKVLDSHVKKYIENAIKSNHSFFKTVSNFFKNHFFVLNSKKEKLSLENNKFGVINNFFIEKKEENIRGFHFDLHRFYRDFYDPFDLYDIKHKRYEYYQKDSPYPKIRHSLLDVFKNFNGINTRDLWSFFSHFESLIGQLRYYQLEHMLINRLLNLVDFRPYIEYTAFYNILFCCSGSIQQGEYVFVSRIGDKKVLSKNRRLHSVDDHAFKFLDGSGLFYFNGIPVEKQLFKLLSEKKYTFEHFTNEKNEEIKSLALAFYEEKFGSDFVREFVSKNLVEADTFVHQKSEEYLEGTKGMNVGVYTLFKGTDKDVQFAYVRCFCPSTDRMFYLGVDPVYIDAKNAIASLCEVPRELRKHLVSIRRQGEIFSFTFDDEGTQKLKENKINLKDTASLNGDEYFDKMEYEY